MALIECPDCGKRISDKADKCPNCGKGLSSSSDNIDRRTIRKGVECGGDIPDDVASCPDCGCPVDANSKSKLEENGGMPNYAAVIPETNHTKPRKKAANKKGKIIIAGVVFIIILLWLDEPAVVAFLALLAAPVSIVGVVIQFVRKRPKKKWGIVLLASVALFLLYVAIPSAHCEHEWQAATCTSPKTCKLCGKTEGEAIGTDHEWVDATCTTPKTCSVCGITEGEVLAHVTGPWDVGEPDLITGIAVSTKKCKLCGKIIDREYTALKYLYEDNIFLFSPEQYTERLELIYNTLPECSFLTTLVVTDDDTMGCVIYDGSQRVGTILFGGSIGFLDGTSRDAEKSFNSMYCSFEGEDISQIAKGVLGIVLTCDPQLEPSDAANVAQNIILSMYSNNAPYYEHGVGYVFGQYRGEYTFVVSVS